MTNNPHDRTYKDLHLDDDLDTARGFANGLKLGLWLWAGIVGSIWAIVLLVDWVQR